MFGTNYNYSWNSKTGVFQGIHYYWPMMEKDGITYGVEE